MMNCPHNNYIELSFKEAIDRGGKRVYDRSCTQLDVIQRLSEAYRANEREIEREITDEEKRKTPSTQSTGPK